MKHITTLHTHDRVFEIVFHCEHYCAIENKYIDSNGCVTEHLNGLQMFANKTLKGCVDDVNWSCKYDELIASGMDMNEAFKKMLM